MRWSASSMPRPNRSNFTSPTAAQSSLSHWRTERPSRRAHSTGQTAITGRSQITIPPEWMPRCRGKPSNSAARRTTSGGMPNPPGSTSARVPGGAGRPTLATNAVLTADAQVSMAPSG